MISGGFDRNSATSGQEILSNQKKIRNRLRSRRVSCLLVGNESLVTIMAKSCSTLSAVGHHVGAMVPARPFEV